MSLYERVKFVTKLQGETASKFPNMSTGDASLKGIKPASYHQRHVRMSKTEESLFTQSEYGFVFDRRRTMIPTRRSTYVLGRKDSSLKPRPE